ncbi:hypothetical protein BT63DRAFT_452634 [Microthyrium microscopicum]|uniref:Myb-like domain-containing protein n=1 Tax=Microthyrium microscopicum TaxID=703497 RepID=A0A6A6UM28_9PEZI|nr:hypothetical protein BT63DRAFT_452634 [Microthyrium microscopicum]
MPPKESKINDDAYLVWVCLRLLAAKSGEQPNWKLVAEALGGTTKPHSIYVRYNSMCKNPPKPASGKDVPNLEEFIAKCIADGSINATRKTAGGSASAKSTPATAGNKRKAGASTPGEAGEDASESEAVAATPTPAVKRKKAAAGGRKGAKKAKSQAAIEEEEELGDDDVQIKAEVTDRDASGETDAEDVGTTI